MNLEEWNTGRQEEAALGEARYKRIRQILSFCQPSSKAVGKTSKMGSNPYPSRMGLPHFSLSFGPHLSNHFCLV